MTNTHNIPRISPLYEIPHTSTSLPSLVPLGLAHRTYHHALQLYPCHHEKVKLTQPESRTVVRVAEGERGEVGQRYKAQLDAGRHFSDPRCSKVTGVKNNVLCISKLQAK